MVIGMAMILLVGSTFFLFEFTRAGTDENALQQAAQIGYRVVDEAANMYVYGEDSFVTVTGSNPTTIQDVYTVDGDTLVFEVVTQNGVVPVIIFSEIPINGTRVDGERAYVNAADMPIRPGNTRYRVTSRGSWVEIEQI